MKKPTTAEKTLLKLRERILRLKRINQVLSSGQSDKTTKIEYYRSKFTPESIQEELVNIESLLAHVIRAL